MHPGPWTPATTEMSSAIRLREIPQRVKTVPKPAFVVFGGPLRHWEVPRRLSHTE
ncbi:hypothetical protein DM02DRAFT_612200 [Periconia macrospinosa]|uniref:Uncharacterized protein n=1 Tax=Periconia macrospinosa TaxID=97972 RepID=A0A2V1DZV1_9PLEO|nr:hypothetical protein DM02DRAFT_612200 [Periconia macrospinosa]